MVGITWYWLFDCKLQRLIYVSSNLKWRQMNLNFLTCNFLLLLIHCPAAKQTIQSY